MTFYDILDHPADLAITFNAPDLPEVFRLAALALFDLLYEKQPGAQVCLRTVEVVSAIDKEELLVNWLNRLIFLQETQGLCGLDFQIELVPENELKAKIDWTETKELPVREIKMTTYHGLKIIKQNKAYAVSILFDL